MRKFSVVLIFLFCGLGLIIAQDAPKAKMAKAPASSNPWLGTWKLDPAQSKYHGEDAPKSETLHLTAASSHGTAYHISGVEGDGKAFTESYRSSGNGKEASMMRNGKPIGKASYTVNEDNSVSGEGEMSDGSKWTMQGTVAPDKKTMTANFHFTPKQGDAFDETEVFTK